MKEEKEELKEKIGLMKSQVEKWKELKKIVETQKFIKRKWTETLYHYKQQQEALNSRIETLINFFLKKENVLIDIKLIILKGFFLFHYEELKKKNNICRDRKVGKTN